MHATVHAAHLVFTGAGQRVLLVGCMECGFGMGTDCGNRAGLERLHADVDFFEARLPSSLVEFCEECALQPRPFSALALQLSS